MSRQRRQQHHHTRKRKGDSLPNNPQSNLRRLQSSLLSTVRLTSGEKSKGLRPGDDFYTYVNGAWERSVHLPPYLSSYGVSEEVETGISKVLYAILNRCTAIAAKGLEPKTPHDAVEDAIGRLVMSSIRPEMQHNSVTYLKRGIRSLGCLRNQTDVAQTLGSLCRFRVPTLLSISFTKLHVAPGKTETVLTLEPGSLGLPDPTYYSASAPGRTRVLYAYTKLLRHISKALEIEDLATGIPVEATFVTELIATKQDENKDFHSIDSLVHAYPKWNWNALFESYGISPAILTGFRIRVESPRWIRFLEHQLTTLPLEQWYAIFAIHTAVHALPYLPPPFDRWHFALYDRLLRGQSNVLPQEELTLRIVKAQMSRGLSYLFVRETLTHAEKEEMTAFARRLLDSAEQRLLHGTFLESETRRRAAAKLRVIRLSVGFEEPNRPPLYPSLQTDNLLSNLYLLEATATDDLIRDLRRKVDIEKEWAEPAYSVNAYYYHELNQLVLPAASAMWPFYAGTRDIRSLAWSLGGLGTVLAHELTHAFDQEGKQFNEQGIETERWWSTADEKTYEEKTRELVRLFNQGRVFGRAVDGALTLDENIADLGGLAIALDALKRELHARGIEGEQALELYRQFFRSYATSWRTKETRNRRLQRLFLDTHAPIEFRVNYIVCHFQEWYDAFDVRTADELYIPPEERIRLF